jgi:periplasmic protein TonB
MAKGFILLVGCAILAGLARAEIRLTASDALKAAVEQPKPEYNPLARQMKVGGDVEVEVRISEKGTVSEVSVVTGNAMLTPNVVKALKIWKFKPFTSGDQPSAAVVNLRFTFKP